MVGCAALVGGAGASSRRPSSVLTSPGERASAFPVRHHHAVIAPDGLRASSRSAERSDVPCSLSRCPREASPCYVPTVHVHLTPKSIHLAQKRSHMLVNLLGRGRWDDVRLQGRTQLHEPVQAAAEVIVPGKQGVEMISSRRVCNAVAASASEAAAGPRDEQLGDAARTVRANEQESPQRTVRPPRRMDQLDLLGVDRWRAVQQKDPIIRDPKEIDRLPEARELHDGRWVVGLEERLQLHGVEHQAFVDVEPSATRSTSTRWSGKKCAHRSDCWRTSSGHSCRSLTSIRKTSMTRSTSITQAVEPARA